MMPPRAPPPALNPADFLARLAIVVPYRDRAEHLARLIPHLVTFFERDRLAQAIPYEIHVVEQSAGGAFNRGAIKNTGFAIARGNADYVSFHDVDYLPIWVDYSAVRCPTSLITWGVENSPAPSNALGGVLALPIADFERINGYSNDYAGWGYEDGDLRERIRRAGLAWERRGGTFTALPHPRNDTSGPEGRLTAGIYVRKLAEGDAGFGREGLSTLKFRVTATTHWQRSGIAQPHVLHHQVVLE